jgi:hypothetical protein
MLAGDQRDPGRQRMRRRPPRAEHVRVHDIGTAKRGASHATKAGSQCHCRSTPAPITSGSTPCARANSTPAGDAIPASNRIRCPRRARTRATRSNDSCAPPGSSFATTRPTSTHEPYDAKQTLAAGSPRAGHGPRLPLPRARWTASTLAVRLASPACAGARIRCVSRRRFVIADAVVALAVVVIAFLYRGVGAALLLAGALLVGHVAAWYALRNNPP